MDLICPRCYEDNRKRVALIVAGKYWVHAPGERGRRCGVYMFVEPPPQPTTEEPKK